MMRKINPQTPLGQLILEKKEIQRQCQESEIQIKEEWHYIRSHAGRLLWSELASVLMPGRKKNGEKMDGGGIMNNPWMHVVWQIAKPVAYRWMGEIGWQVFKSMFRKKR